MRRASALACLWCVIAAAQAAAQDRQPSTRRIGFDTVAGTQDFFTA